MLWWKEKMESDRAKIQTFVAGGTRDKFRGNIGLEALPKSEGNTDESK